MLAPACPGEDPVLAEFYNYADDYSEFAAVFDELRLRWEWRLVTLDTYRTVIEELVATADSCSPYVLNLCDGDGIHGFPGPEVVSLLETLRLPFTGADSDSYALSTSRIVMKETFDETGTRDARWETIDLEGSNIDGFFDRLGRPLIVKPAVSGGQMGIGLRSIVQSEDEILACLRWLGGGVHGWDTAAGGILVEKFISGREFTVLSTGTHTAPDEIRVLQPIEKVFHSELPKHERLCTFDRASIGLLCCHLPRV